MMKVKVQEVGNGLHPSEVVVGVRTSSGVERLVVSRRAVEGGTMDIGYPINQDQDNNYLVELPRETQSGSWRVWISKDQVE